MEGARIANISVAIPTLNRHSILKEVLHSILRQTELPREVIIVDDSTNDRTKIMLSQMSSDFSAKNLALKYVRGGSEGLAQARNIGVANATGEFLFSIDDDVILDVNYVKEIMRVYSKYPNALGVAGHIENVHFSSFSNAIYRVFSPFSWYAKDECRVFPTGTSYPYPLTRIRCCEWFSGSNATYKMDILQKFKWDENLKKSSLCEDLDISYRIQLNYPNSLLMTPYAKIIHKTSPLARIGLENGIRMEFYHRTYMFFKNMKQTLRNMLIFVYGLLFGKLVLSLLSRNSVILIFTIKGQLSTMRNLRKIKRGVLGPF